MAGLSSALSSALSGLLVSSGQSALVSRNISRAADEDYSRKYASLSSFSDGTVRLTNTSRNTEHKLMSAVLDSRSQGTFHGAMSLRLNELHQTIGDVEADGSIAWSIGKLERSLRDFSANPSSMTLAGQAIRSAGDVAHLLNDASAKVQTMRSEADQEMARSVATVNQLLNEIETLNSEITGASSTESNVAEFQDRRDAALKKLSDEIGIRVVERPNNGISVFTSSGISLFDVSARKVAFQPTTSMGATSAGNAVYIDGVPAFGSDSPMEVKTGRIAALAQIRDSIAPTYQIQLDEVARTLVATFAETDQQSIPTLPAATGLFRYSGSPSVPVSATVIPGISGTISIDSAFDQTKGGSPFLLRDGGRNGASYVYNTNSTSGFQTRLTQLAVDMGSTLGFAAVAELSTATSMQSFAAQSAGWIEERRAVSEAAQTKADALQARAKDALLRKTGVNMDEEMASLLELERSYQASAKVMSTIDNFFAALMQAV